MHLTLLSFEGLQWLDLPSARNSSTLPASTCETSVCYETEQRSIPEGCHSNRYYFHKNSLLDPVLNQDPPAIYSLHKMDLYFIYSIT
jgi:hypothetical protein